MPEAPECPAIELPRAERPGVSICIIATRAAARLAGCLEAIARHAPAAIPLEVILILNDARPDVRKLVKTRVRGARIVDLDVNAGTAGGWNLALRGARGRWVQILHEDSVVERGWLEPLVDVLERHPEVAVAGSRLLNADGSLQNVGWIVWRDGWPTQISAAILPEAPAITGVTAVDSVSSAAMLVDGADLSRCGGFDERLSPATFVELHLHTTLWGHGRATVLVPDSVVRHESGAMVARDGDPFASEQFRMWLFLRNLERFRALDAELLAVHEPRTTDELRHVGFDTDGVRRALARAEERRRAAVPERPAPLTPGRHASAATWGPAPEEHRRLATERAAAERAFVAWLTEKEAEARAGFEATAQAVRNQQQRIDELIAENMRLAGQVRALEARPRRRRWLARGRRGPGT